MRQREETMAGRKGTNTEKNLSEAFAGASPLFGESGRFAGCFAMVTDITDLKRAEEASKLSQFIIDKASIG